nr:Src homology-3 and Immunoglobulin I-set and Fibronectin and Serine threonine protein kinase-related domain containing protein [Haemonchus contortus]
MAYHRKTCSQEKRWSDLPLRGVACCAYHHLRKGEVDLEPGEQVDILEVFGGFSHVLKKNGQDGSVPSYFLELVDIPGDTLAEQIEYRRMWHAIVDEVIPTDSPVTPLSSGEDIRAVVPIIPDGRPVFVIPLADVNVCEGDRVVLRPEISSTTPFTVTWRGPAVEAGRAEVKSDGESTSLIIKKITALDYGPYSVVAKNDYGIASSVSVVKVITHPDPPASLVCERIGRNALLLTWNPGFRKGLYYGVEFQSEDMGQYRCVASALRTTTISLRHFRPVRYRIRVFSYNFGLRSRPSKEVEIDFSKRISLLVAVLSVLHHSSMPRLKGVFTSDGRYCIAMKKMPGVGISAYVDEFVHMHDESGELERLLRRLSGDILGALSYLHARDIVHLDVKPLNLLVSDHVYLIDFGCARFVDDEEALAWTDSDKSYSAPERIAGKPPSTASDIWSFGAVLFELCFGVAPHHMLPTLTTNPEQRSPALLSFLNEVLALEASRRPTAEECLQKGWFKKVTHLEVPHETREFSRSVSFEG